jgi:hypothetical protein
VSREPVGVGTPVKKGNPDVDLHSGTQSGQADRVRRGVLTATLPAAAMEASMAKAKVMK